MNSHWETNKWYRESQSNVVLYFEILVECSMEPFRTYTHTHGHIGIEHYGY